VRFSETLNDPAYRPGLFMADIDFLTFEDVMELHVEQLATYGGLDGILDDNIVRSAVAMPQATMFGQFLHKDLAEMGAAYLFHFAAAQGFVDGNKRTGVVSAVEFLARNGYMIDASDDEMYETTMSVANNQMSKQKLADWIRPRLRPVP
jgi:death-on-curing protein